jgi:hypothetical protein
MPRPGFDPSILRHSRIWGAADEAVLNNIKKNPPLKKNLNLFRFASNSSLIFAYFLSFRFRFFLGEAIFLFIYVSLGFFCFISLIFVFASAKFSLPKRKWGRTLLRIHPYKIMWIRVRSASQVGKLLVAQSTGTGGAVTGTGGAVQPALVAQ